MALFPTVVISKVMEVRGKSLLRKLQKDSSNVERVQRNVLLNILKHQENTDFGKKYNFKSLKSISDFQNALPIMKYEDLWPWIDRQENEKKSVINSEMPILYAVTSGTTGQPKYIPILKRSLKSYKNIQKIFVYSLYRVRPNIFDGSILAIVSAPIEGYLPTGSPFGSTSGYIYQTLPKVARQKYVLPISVLSIKDYDLRYKAIVRLAIEDSSITYIGTANPSTIIKLIQVLNQNLSQFIQDLERGSFFALSELDGASLQYFKKKMKPNPQRAQILKDAIKWRCCT